MKTLVLVFVVCIGVTLTVLNQGFAGVYRFQNRLNLSTTISLNGIKNVETGTWSNGGHTPVGTWRKGLGTNPNPLGNNKNSLGESKILTETTLTNTRDNDDSVEDNGSGEEEKPKEEPKLEPKPKIVPPPPDPKKLRIYFMYCHLNVDGDNRWICENTKHSESDELKITWEEQNSTNVTAYKIFRSDSENGKYELAKTINATEKVNNNYEFVGKVTDGNGKDYFYKIRSVSENKLESEAVPFVRVTLPKQNKVNLLPLYGLFACLSVAGFAIGRSYKKK